MFIPFREIWKRRMAFHTLLPLDCLICWGDDPFEAHEYPRVQRACNLTNVCLLITVELQVSSI